MVLQKYIWINDTSNSAIFAGEKCLGTLLNMTIISWVSAQKVAYSRKVDPNKQITDTIPLILSFWHVEDKHF